MSVIRRSFALFIATCTLTSVAGAATSEPASGDRLNPRVPSSRKVLFSAVLSPETAAAGVTRPFTLCLNNLGGDGVLVRDGKEDDHLDLSLPRGPGASDLDEGGALACTEVPAGWDCSVATTPDVIVVTLGPTPPEVAVGAGESACFVLGPVVVNASRGVALAVLDASLDRNRAEEPLNHLLPVFKSPGGLMSHDELSDVRADQHHPRYTDAEAVAANAPIVAALEARIARLEDLLVHVSRSGDDLTIAGANLHLVSGAGATDAAPNGKGNLLIGYNETPRFFPASRGGSHNLVVGMEHNYASYGGIVGGLRNQVTGPHAVGFGLLNVVSGRLATVTGGAQNRAGGDTATVLGGAVNNASGTGSTIVGGGMNVASGPGSVVVGGDGNVANGTAAVVAGGGGNRAECLDDLSTTDVEGFCTVSGGRDRTVTGTDDWRAGSLFEDE